MSINQQAPGFRKKVNAKPVCFLSTFCLSTANRYVPLVERSKTLFIMSSSVGKYNFK